MTTWINKVTITIAMCLTFAAVGQIKPRVYFGNGIDNTTKDITEIKKLIVSYFDTDLFTENNQFWTTSKRCNQVVTKQLLRGHQSTNDFFSENSIHIVSIKVVHHAYEVKTIVVRDSMKNRPGADRILCSFNLKVLKDLGKWKFVSRFNENVAHFQSKNSSYIKYFYPIEYQFDETQIEQTKALCDYVNSTFEWGSIKPFYYYISNSPDDLNELLGIQYNNMKHDCGFNSESVMVTTTATAFDAHNLIHQLVPENRNRSLILDEGMAHWLGDSQDPIAFKASLKSLAKFHFSGKTKKLSGYIENANALDYKIAGTIGALILKIVYDRKKNQGVKKLIMSNTLQINDFESEIKKVCGMNLAKLSLLWEKELRKQKK